MHRGPGPGSSAALRLHIRSGAAGSSDPHPSHLPPLSAPPMHLVIGPISVRRQAGLVEGQEAK